MKYEDWIKYENERLNQLDVFAWVSIPERPQEEITRSAPVSEPDLISKQKEIPRFSNIHLCIHR